MRLLFLGALVVVAACGDGGGGSGSGAGPRSPQADWLKDEVARLPGVDRNASHAMFDKDIVLVPHVGPNGELQTIAYRVEPQQHRLSALGPAMPRVEHFPIAGIAREVYATTKPSGGKGHLVPLTKAGTIAQLDERVIGVTAIRTTTTSSWAGWMTEWKEGGFSRSLYEKVESSKDLSSSNGPRWTRFSMRQDSGHEFIVGELPDGTCEVEAITASGSLTTLRAPPRPTCDEAFTATFEKLQERELRQAQADTSRRDREKNAPSTPPPQTRAGFDVRYRQLGEAGKFAEQCALITSTLSPQDHVQAVYQRILMDHDFVGEATCVQKREPRSATRIQDAVVEQRSRLAVKARKEQEGAKAAAAYAAQKQEERDQNARDQAQIRRTNAELYPSSGSPSSPSQQTQKVNDYLYGSQKGTQCPYTDTSLCRK